MTFTDDQILDLDGVYVRLDSFRWPLINLSGSEIGELHPSLEQPPVVDCDTARKGRTVTSLVLPASEVTDINPISDGLTPVMVLQNGSEFPLGIYRWADEVNDELPWGIERASSLVDRTVILDQETTGVFSRPIGYNLVTAARDLAASVIPAEQISATPSTTAVSPWVGLSHPPGVNRLGIINELLAIAGYLPAYFDEVGQLIMRPAPKPTDDVDRSYPVGSHIVAESIRRWNTLLDVPNWFQVFEASGAAPPYKAIMRVPDDAPHSRANRGHIVPRNRGVSGLSSQEQARVFCQALAVEEGTAYEFLNFDTPTDPRHGTFDHIEFHGETGWLETAWRLVCAPAGAGGIMAHQCRRIYDLVED